MALKQLRPADPTEGSSEARKQLNIVITGCTLIRHAVRRGSGGSGNLQTASLTESFER